MLGSNPRKVASTPTSPPKTAMSIQTQSTDGGLMVKAMDEIFRHVEQADNPESFKVINTESIMPFVYVAFPHYPCYFQST